MNAQLKKYIFALLLAALVVASRPALAAKAAGGEETLTKGEAIMLISATDFMKQKIGELFSWTVGYDVTKVNRVRLTPTINYVRALPKRVPPDGRTVVEVVASVDDPSGLLNIAGVRADLSSIGRLVNMMLVGDGLYTLQTSVSPKTDLGPKDIPVAVANKKGWLALAKTTLDIKKNPTILEVRCQPDRVLADGRSSVTISVKIDNPGRLSDVSAVSVDLQEFGLPDRVGLLNDGSRGDKAAGDDLWTIQFAMPAGVAPGTYLVPLQVTNLIGGLAAGETTLAVYK
jgi:hypothetical protein